MNWTFQITHNSVTTQVYPEYNNLVFKDTPVKDQVFFRRTLETEFNFTGIDFDTLYSIDTSPERCEQIDFEVYYKGVIYWSGQLKLVNAKTWDLSKCRVSIKPDLNDEFTCLFNIWEESKNVYPVTPIVQVSAIVGEVVFFPCITPPSSGWPLYPNDCTDGIEWTLIEFESSAGDESANTIWAREEITTDCSGGVPVAPPGTGWVLVTDDCAGSNTSTYARKLSTYLINDYIDELGKHILYGISGYRDENITYPNGRRLNDVLEYLVSDCGLDIESNFLDLNAPGGAPSNTPYTASNPNCHNLALFQKTDIKHPTYSEHALLLEMSLKEVLDWLRETLQVYWVVEGTTLIIEHVSYFASSNGQDLTATDPEQIKSLSQFNYNAAGLPKFEKFEWQDPTNDEDFKGLPIIYDNSCSDESLSNDITVARLVTDIVTTAQNGDDVSDEGFVMVAMYEYDSNYYITSEIGEISGEVKLNGHLSWANLHVNYWTYERPQISGNMNGADVTFDSVIPIKKQVPLSVKMLPAAYQATAPNDKMQSYIGWGKVEELTYNATSGRLEINLIHE